ncbi:Protein of unknown function (DUF1644) [Quillaja saponaria]|uniref:Uncharacterized protein n=1 Tax=Quillaja saponaria TaxID=32244 RepID=A0AAD7PQ94_QUISA|nr:Protein of unknown function (DUF1644) [Quillaja saponaria]KAJ7962896.1 Protein of unknown function (DUF1644) [Quillaja saponaria]
MPGAQSAWNTPHNAVLQKCSSYEMGCRPYMCNTSYRHSNCLDQFCKSNASYLSLSSAILQEIPLTSTPSHRSQGQSQPGHVRQFGSQLQTKPACPLCRGQINGYVVLEPARIFMNSKPRNCSAETCDFYGSYSELRKHARSEHPTVRPSEVDPTRQHEWSRLEQERDFEDVLSSIQLGFEEESGGDSNLSVSFDELILFLSRAIGGAFQITPDDSTDRVSLRTRPSGSMLRLSYDSDTNYQARRRSNSSRVHDADRNYPARQGASFSLSHNGEMSHTSRWSTRLSPDQMRYSRQYGVEPSSRRRRIPLHRQ